MADQSMFVAMRNILSETRYPILGPHSSIAPRPIVMVPLLFEEASVYVWYCPTDGSIHGVGVIWTKYTTDADPSTHTQSNGKTWNLRTPLRPIRLSDLSVDFVACARGNVSDRIRLVEVLLTHVHTTTIRLTEPDPATGGVYIVSEWGVPSAKSLLGCVEVKRIPLLSCNVLSGGGAVKLKRTGNTIDIYAQWSVSTSDGVAQIRMAHEPNVSVSALSEVPGLYVDVEGDCQCSVLWCYRRFYSRSEPVDGDITKRRAHIGTLLITKV